MDPSDSDFLGAGVRFLHAYFDQAAASYAEAIEPAFAPLAAGLIEFAGELAPGPVADLGSGTGLVSRAVRGQSVEIFALDISRRMLIESRLAGLAAAVQGDLHRLPIHSEVVGLALASFAFNSTDPALSFAEVGRVIRPGGRLVLQEWGAPDDLGELVSDTLAAYAVDEPPPALRALREGNEQRVPWDDLETIDDIARLVGAAGLAVDRLDVAPVEVRLPSLDAFLRYKLGWPSRRAEVEAMSDVVRRLMLDDLHENLSPHLEADGGLLWRPEIIRLSSRKPA